MEDWPTASGGFSASKRLLGVSQTLPFPGKKSLDGRIGASGVRIGQAHLALRRLEIIRDVKAAFYAVLAAERLVEVSRELARVAESSATVAWKRVDAGAAPLQEQLRAEVERDRASAALRGREGELGIARQTLAAILGRPELADTPVSGTLPEAVAPDTAASSTDASSDEHPVVAGSAAARERADFEWRRARLGPYPDLTVAVAAGRVGLENQSVIQVGVSLALPLFDRGQGRKQETRANLAAADAELVAARQRLRLARSAAERRLRTASDQALTHRERILPRAEEALRLVQIGFTEGKLGFIDLLDTQRTSGRGAAGLHRDDSGNERGSGGAGGARRRRVCAPAAPSDREECGNENGMRDPSGAEPAASRALAALVACRARWRSRSGARAARHPTEPTMVRASGEADEATRWGRRCAPSTACRSASAASAIRTA